MAARARVYDGLPAVTAFASPPDALLAAVADCVGCQRKVCCRIPLLQQIRGTIAGTECGKRLMHAEFALSFGQKTHFVHCILYILIIMQLNLQSILSQQMVGFKTFPVRCAEKRAEDVCGMIRSGSFAQFFHTNVLWSFLEECVPG